MGRAARALFSPPPLPVRLLGSEPTFPRLCPFCSPEDCPTNAGVPLTPAAPHTTPQSEAGRRGRSDSPAALRAGQVSGSDPAGRPPSPSPGAPGTERAGPPGGGTRCGVPARAAPARGRARASRARPRPPAPPPGRRVLGEDPARPRAAQPRRIRAPRPPSGPRAGRPPAGREVVLARPRPGSRVAGQRLRGSEGGGAARPACGWRPLSAVPAPGPPPPRRPPSAPVRGAPSQPPLPPRPPLRGLRAPSREAGPGLPGARRRRRGAAMDGKTHAGVALVPGPSGRGPSARRCRRRPGLLLPGLWLLLLARPASCAPGKHRGDPRAAAGTLPSFIAAIFKIRLSPPRLFYSPPLPRPAFWRCFSILLGPSK